VAHSLSAKKRIRQNARRRARNRSRKRVLKGEVRAFNEALAGGDAGKAGEALRSTIKRIDQTAARGTIHKNTASRRKSRLQKKLNALAAKSS
jgi:small subunit ribosomal protein S20